MSSFLFRYGIVFVILISPFVEAQTPDVVACGGEEAAESEPPDSPGALQSASPTRRFAGETYVAPMGSYGRSRKSISEKEEPYHWKGLALQSFAFDMLSNATRIVTASQHDRRLVVHVARQLHQFDELGDERRTCILVLRLAAADAFERSGDGAFTACAPYNERGRWLDYFYGSRRGGGHWRWDVHRC